MIPKAYVGHWKTGADRPRILNVLDYGLPVIDVTNQEAKDMALGVFAKHWKTPVANRQRILNVLGLNISKTTLREELRLPDVVREIGWPAGACSEHCFCNCQKCASRVAGCPCVSALTCLTKACPCRCRKCAWSWTPNNSHEHNKTWRDKKRAENCHYPGCQSRPSSSLKYKFCCQEHFHGIERKRKIVKKTSMPKNNQRKIVKRTSRSTSYFLASITGLPSVGEGFPELARWFGRWCGRA